MPQSDEPVAERHIIAALAQSVKLNVNDLYTPVLAAKSFLSGSGRRLMRVEQIVTRSSHDSGPGFIDALRVIGGLIGVAEGISIAANAATIGTTVVQILGIAVPAAAATLIGIGLILLGGYFLVKGVQALWPFIRKRLEDEMGASAWREFFNA